MAVPAPGDETAKTEAEKLQGTWTVVSAEYDAGKTADEELIKNKGLKWEFVENKITVHFGDKSRGMAYKLDPSKKLKELDLTYTEGRRKGKTDPAIYALEGDTLRICIGKDRPTEFVTKDESARYLLILKKEKP